MSVTGTVILIVVIWLFLGISACCFGVYNEYKRCQSKEEDLVLDGEDIRAIIFLSLFGIISWIFLVVYEINEHLPIRISTKKEKKNE